MAVELVTIVHPNGQKGVVAATYQPLVDGDLKKAPSQRSRDAQDAAEMPSLPALTEPSPGLDQAASDLPADAATSSTDTTPSDAANGPSTDTQE